MQDDTRGGGHMLIFKDILGHEQIKEHFQNAAKKGKTCRCNLFSEIQEVENHPIYIGTY